VRRGVQLLVAAWSLPQVGSYIQG